MWTNSIFKRSSPKCSSGEPTDFGVLAPLAMTDFHSHVLPGMDDGSPDVETSLAMLSEMKRQGTASVVATPHFYADREYPDAFLARREKAVAALAPFLRAEQSPAVYLGAEVAYFPGIGETPDLRKLCILGTRFVLVEMPFSRWTSFALDDVIAIRERLGLFPILAHIERYFSYFRSADMDRLAESNLLVQSNAGFFLERQTHRRALSMLNRSEIQLLGTDSHNMSDRKPNLGEALLSVREKTENDALWRVASMGRQILIGAEPITKF